MVYLKSETVKDFTITTTSGLRKVKKKKAELLKQFINSSQYFG